LPSGRSSPLPEIRTASMPSGSSTPAAPGAIGKVRRPNCANAPSECGTEPSSSRSDAATVRSSPTFPRPTAFDQATTSGPLERAAPRFDSTTTATTFEGSEICSAKRRAPASPSWLPSTDASTSVFCDARPSNTRANSMSAAVSAALPVSSGTSDASRAASTTISLFEAPGRRPITLTRRVPFSSKRSIVVGNLCDRNACFTRDATAASPGRPARLSGVVEVMLRTMPTALVPSNRASAARPWSSGRGGVSSENATSTSASSAGRNAAR
jgi:hypothetical protein